jgi:hypothetical protein
MADPLSPHRPRALRRSVAILALLLAVRALVPVGFMASATEAGIQLVFCDAGAIALQMGGHHAHHHHAGGTTDPGCPYAQSSGPAPLPSLPMLASDVRVVRIAAPVESSAVIAPQGPHREQSPRGPPFLS